MRKKWIAAALVCTMGVTSLAGCGNSANSNASTEADAQDTQSDDGVVTLKVWSEESNFDFMNQMIESFKQEYAGQAQFDITLEANADSEAKNNALGDILNSADVYPLADDQITGLVAGGALYPVPDADDVKAANDEGAVAAANLK